MWSLVRTVFTVALITVALFGLIELGVRFFAPQDNKSTYLSGGPVGLKDDVLGHTNRPLTKARVRAPEFVFEYSVDENGFRNSQFEAKQRDLSADTTRILLLGDSFTFGTASNYSDIWPVLLTRRFESEGRRVEIINAGVPGYDTSQQALYLERLFDEIRPDIALVTFLPNDLFANEPIRTIDGIEVARGDARAVVSARGKKSSSLHAVTLLKRLLMSFDRSYISLYLLTPRKQFFANPASEMFNAKLETTKSLMERMAKFCAARDSRLVVVSVPQLFQVLFAANGNIPSDLNPHQPDDALADFAVGQGIEWVATLDKLAHAYAQRNEDLYYRFDGHLNTAGNRILADIVFDAISPMVP